MSLPADLFNESDLAQLRGRGLDVEEGRRQIRCLVDPPGFTALDRPCTLGDGIESFAGERVAELAAVSDRAAREGRVVKVVPASGAASRMFKSLLAYRTRGGITLPAELDRDVKSGDTDAQALRAFIDGLSRFAFHGTLDGVVGESGGDLAKLANRGPFEPVLDALLSPDGMDYARLPKGLLEFHAYPGRSRTPFEEHLVEAATLVRDKRGRCAAHFTVSPAHLDLFRELLARVGGAYEERLGAIFDVTFSMQKPSSDTLAVDSDGRPFRSSDGSILFRPAGHGALIENLDDLDADIVLIKNVDNVVPDSLKEPGYIWSKVLIGALVEIRDAAHDLLRRLEDDPESSTVVDEAASFIHERLHRSVTAKSADADERRCRVVEALGRPIRVCGMVVNTGEPGGGPFWVRSSDIPQIVETVQIDPDSAEQQAVLARSTHFNPVFLACGLRDHRGRAYNLQRFIDQDAVIVSQKSHEGRPLRSLERPGLWNGAMAHWNTLFAEVPTEVFNPVKTILDLLRPTHQ